MTPFTPTNRAARRAAVGAAIGFAGIAAFQLALAAGAPLGHAAWGGMSADLSTAQRAGSSVAVVVWGTAGFVVLGRAGFWRADSMGRLFHRGAWFLVGVSAFSALPNFASESRWENFILGPTALVLAGLCLVVARSPATEPTLASAGLVAGR